MAVGGGEGGESEGRSSGGRVRWEKVESEVGVRGE